MESPLELSHPNPKFQPLNSPSSIPVLTFRRRQSPGSAPRTPPSTSHQIPFPSRTWAPPTAIPSYTHHCMRHTGSGRRRCHHRRRRHHRSSSLMGKKALLIGCNYPGTKAELKGCINNVCGMHRCLVDRFGFSEAAIVVLIDTNRSGDQPTSVNIRKAVIMLIRFPEPGDVLFFRYSGHGTRLLAETGDDDDTLLTPGLTFCVADRCKLVLAFYRGNAIEQLASMEHWRKLEFLWRHDRQWFGLKHSGSLSPISSRVRVQQNRIFCPHI